MLVGPDDYCACADELRDLLAAGWSVGDALRQMHHVRGHGLMWLVGAVVAVLGVSRPDAMKLVVKETFR
jgi:hypothetical protein